jgi:hypothetical protein
VLFSRHGMGGPSESFPTTPDFVHRLAGIVLLTLIVRFSQIRRRVKRPRLGRDGERCVGQFLERLREDDAQIFHDVPAEGFNLDHVIVSPNGI